MRCGIYFPTLDALPAIKAAGFDYVLVWNQQDPWPFLNNPYGLKVAIDVRNRESIISQIGTHRNLCAWYIGDEPQTWAELAYLRAIYNTYKPLTPYPIFLANLPRLLDNALWQQLVNLGDIACIDEYPKTVFGYYPDNVSISIRAAKVAAPGKPLIYISQAFGGDIFLNLTGAEYLDTVRRAKNAGATGLLAFAWNSYIVQNAGVTGVSPNHPLWPAIIESNKIFRQAITPAVLLVGVASLCLVAALKK